MNLELKISVNLENWSYKKCWVNCDYKNFIGSKYNFRSRWILQKTLGKALLLVGGYTGIKLSLSSISSEEKARLLREVGDMVEDKDAELAVFLSSLKLEEIPNPGDHIALPPEVIGKAIM